MSFLRLKSSFLVPLILAAGLLFSLPRIPFLVQLEHFFYPPPERFQPDSYSLESNSPADFQLKAHHFTKPADHPANIGSYFIDEETREIMGPHGGDPVEWAQFLRQTRLPDDRLIVITSSFSWPDATALALLALQEQVDLTPRLVVGLQAELLNLESPLPPELKKSIIPLVPPPHFTFPEIDHLSVPPSITSPLFGISEVRGLKIEKERDLIRIPMIVRWGNHLLPSLQLASLLTYHHLTPSDLIIDSRGYLHLGTTGPIIRIDPSGFTWLPSQDLESQPAATLQIYPTRAETTKIITPSPPPLPAKNLASQLRQAVSQLPHLEKTYRRWPLPVEITLLVFLSLILQPRRSWLFPLAAILISALSLFLNRWLLVSPVALLALAHLTCSFANKRPPAPKTTD